MPDQSGWWEREKAHHYAQTLTPRPSNLIYLINHTLKQTGRIYPTMKTLAQTIKHRILDSNRNITEVSFKIP